MHPQQFVDQGPFLQAHPWVFSANVAILHWLFRALPHSYLNDSVAEFLVRNPFLSTWIFGAAFYVYWRAKDQRTDDNRRVLVSGLIGSVLALAVSLALGLWIHWPSPARTSGLQSLYTPDFWVVGTSNSFPSTSTVVYFTIALSFWSISRRLSLLLILQTLVTVSLPRVYIGGHYPVDIAASIAISLICYGTIRNLAYNPWAGIKGRASQLGPSSSIPDLLLFLWLFELSNGFHASEGAMASILHVSRHLAGK